MKELKKWLSVNGYPCWNPNSGFFGGIILVVIIGSLLAALAMACGCSR